MRIFAFEVDHRPWQPAFGFVFESAGRRVAFSGDTAVCDNLLEWACGADLLVHECFIHREMRPIAGVRTEEGVEQVASYHTLSSEVGKVAREAGARLLVLNHFVPVEFDRDALLDEIRADFSGPVVIGEDLVSINVVRRALAFRELRLGLGEDPDHQG